MSTRRFNRSCKPCHKSRIGCDAVLQQGNPCTNCIRREKVCDSQNPSSSRNNYRNVSPGRGASNARTIRRNHHARESRQFDQSNDLPSSSLSSSDAQVVANQRTNATALHDLLWGIFFSVFEARSAFWFADSCCPYLELKVGPKPPVSRTVVELDRANSYPVPHDSSSHAARHHATSSLHILKSETILNDALRYAIYVYASSWLPFQDIAQRGQEADDIQARHLGHEIRAHLWRRARAAILPAMSRPSYRSVLALMLFGFTEMPVDTDDHGLNQLCSDALFSHLNYLRSPLQSRASRPLCDFNTVLPPNPGQASVPTPELMDDGRESQKHMRGNVFWLGVIVDTTRSLLQQRPSILLPGRSGDEKVWNFIRQRTIIFDQSFRSLHGSPLPLTRDVTTTVLQHASACKTMYLGMMNQFFDAVLNYPPEFVEDAAERVVVESRRFHNAFDQLLAMCARDYMTMSGLSQLNYILVVTHYHLGSLVLADFLESQHIAPEPLREPTMSREYACNVIINAISLALNHDRYTEGLSSYGSILLRDPSPSLMVETLSRTSKSIFRLHETGRVTISTAQIMISVIFSALTVLSDVSLTATFVLASIRQSSASTDIKFRSDGHHMPMSLDSKHREIVSNCDCSTIDDFLQEMHIQVSGDPFFMDRNIAKYEPSAPESPGVPEEAGSDGGGQLGTSESSAMCDFEATLSQCDNWNPISSLPQPHALILSPDGVN